MRQEFQERLQALLKEKVFGGWKDGWVYGRLKQEFALESDELNAIASSLGFKYGWNSTVEELLESQWQEAESIWINQKLTKTRKTLAHTEKKAIASHEIQITQKMNSLLEELEASNEINHKISDLEKTLTKLILNMKLDDQLWLLESICNRQSK